MAVMAQAGSERTPPYHMFLSSRYDGHETMPF
jgi:hypothetical protein